MQVHIFYQWRIGATDDYWQGGENSQQREYGQTDFFQALKHSEGLHRSLGQTQMCGS